MRSLLRSAMLVPALVVALAACGGDSDAEGATVPEVGACVSGPGAGAIACDDAAATFVVTADDGECDSIETAYAAEGAAGSDLCLDLNAAEGDCFDPPTTSQPVAKVSCADTTAISRVKVTATGALDVKCGKGDAVRRNETRDTVVCLGSPTDAGARTGGEKGTAAP